MNFLSFNSQSPCEHVPRVLDLLRVMSFELDELKVDPHEGRSFCVEMTCKAVGTMNPQTLKNRVANIPGIQKIHFL